MSNKSSSGESFAGNVMKYSIATYLGFGITGAGIIIRGILGPDATGIPFYFITCTQTLMYFGILGMDQALLRFYAHPPEGCTGRDLFKACAGFSLGFMALAAAVCCVFFPAEIAGWAGLSTLGSRVVPLLFLNAALYMVVRYLNVLLRLEGNLVAYTAETLWMQACLQLLYLLPGFFTSNVYAFLWASVASFGAVAVGFAFKIREPKTARSHADYLRIFRTILPYGLPLAPTQVLNLLNSTLSQRYILQYTGATQQGVYSFGITLSNLVTVVQAGFSTYWGPYVFAHYREEQERIGRVHDILNLMIFGFFCCLVMFEDVLFLIFPAYKSGLQIFPLLMLAAVFTILCEGTVYGNSIARRPYHDTIGFGISVAVNVALCALLVPRMGLLGGALALACGNGGMFVYRTVTGQYYYRTIPSYARTVSGFLLAFAVTAIGVVLYQHFLLKFALVGAILFVYCTLYRPQLVRLWQMGLGIARKFLNRNSTMQ